MAKLEWGTKRTCHSCGARFYDLRRDPILCPVCSAVYDPERQPKPRRSGPVIKDEPVLVPDLVDDTVEERVDEDAVEVETAESDDLEDAEAADGGDIEELSTENGELMEDTSELGEDDDDIGEVMEHVDDELDEKP